MNPILISSLMSRLAQEIPDSGGDMLAGYLVASVIILGYILSLALRFRNLKREQAMLDEAEE